MVNFLLLISTLSFAAVSTTDRALVERGNNLLVNGGFESGRAQWTASGGTFVTTSTAADVGKGSIAGAWNSSGAAQTLTTTAVTIPGGLRGRNGVASCLIENASATHTIQAYDGSNILASTTITSQTAYARTSVNFIFPSSGSVSLRLVSVAADEPLINIDDCYLGDAEGYNISQVSQANLIGSAYFATTASCTFTRTNTALGALADTDCPGPTVESNPGPGTIQTTDANAPIVTVNDLPPGTYVAHFVGGSYITTSTQAAAMAINDGTTTAGQTTINGNLNTAPFHVAAVFSYSAAGNKSFQLYASSAANAVEIPNAASNQRLFFYLERFPSSSEIAYRADLVNWKVDANISGASPSLGTAAQTAYIGIENGSLTLTNNAGSGNLTAQIPCSSTNSPTGTTCSVGNESLGVSFTIPVAGDVEVCGEFGVSSTDGATDPQTAFQWVETASNAQTIIQEGKSRKNNLLASSTGIIPYNICGTFTFNSIGQKTLRLMYEQTAATTATVLALDADASVGQRDMHITVRPLTNNLPVPVLVGSVTSNSSGQERIERVSVTTSCTSTPCTIASQSGSWLTSISRASAGNYTLNIAAGMFSATPTCVCYAGNTSTLICQRLISASTSSAININTSAVTTGTSTDGTFEVMCMGPR